MTTVSKPYAEYKESGLQWLEQIPSHWKVLPLRALLTERKEKNDPIKTKDILSLSLKSGVIPYADKGPGGNKAKDDLSAYMLAYPGDIVVNSMNVVVGSVGLSKYFGAVSPVYYMLRPRDRQDLSEYFEAIFRASVFNRSLFGLGNGILVIQSKSSGKLNTIRMRIPMNRLRRVQLPYPPPDEQKAIVQFLLWATRKLDQAIRSKQRVIELLNEQKQSTIYRTVTRGLDPSVSLKPTGVPWLGEVPDHWRVIKLKFLVSSVGGMTPNKGVDRYWDGQIPWISPKDMKVREIRDSQDHISECALSETNVSLIEPPAVLIVVRGMILARTFPIAITKVPITINQDMKALLPGPDIHADFLVSVLTGLQKDILSIVEESGHGTRCLRTDAWSNFALPVPPYDEQERINKFLESELKGLNTATARLEREIELLMEYRARLVADVVTGKLDVREAAAQLSVETDHAPPDPDLGTAVESDSADEECLV